MDDWVEVSEDPDHELDEDKLLLVKKRGGCEGREWEEMQPDVM